MANYQIQKGDTLSKIAAAQGTTVAALQGANPQITNPNLIYAGANLTIPTVNGSPVINTDTLQQNGTIPTLPNVNQVTTPEEFAAGLPQQPGLVPQEQTNKTGLQQQNIAPGTAPTAAQQRLALYADQQKLLGEGARKQELQTSKDIPGMETYKAKLQGEYKTLNEAFNSKVQGTASNTFGVESQDTRINAINRQKASQLGYKLAEISAVEGNIAAANKQVDDAIAFEFAPYKQEIENLEQFQEFNNNDLTDKERLVLSAQLDRQKMEYASKLELANYKAKNAIDTAAYEGGFGGLATAPNTYTLIAGDDPYFIAQNNGIDMAELTRLNPQVKDWRNVSVGTKINLPTVNATNNMQALNIILASAKFTKDQKADLIRGINSGQDPFTIIKNQAKNIMGQTEATTLGKYETAKSQLSDINSLLKQYYSNGGKTSFLSGKYEKAVNNLGAVNDPKLVNIATQIAVALQNYRNAVSGTAYSVQEGADIASIFPGINKNEGLNTAIVNGRLAAFDSQIDGTYRNFLGDAYNQFKVDPGTFSGVKIPSGNNSAPLSFGGVQITFTK